jgi:hypothetical protein
LFEFLGAVAVAARPWFSSVRISAVLAGVRILDAKEMEILLPIGPFLLQGTGAKAHFDPRTHAISLDAGSGHILQIFIARDRTLAQSA